MLKFFSLFFILLFTTAFGQTLIVNSDKENFYDFSISVYEDKTASLPLEQIKNKPFSAIQNSLSLGYSDSNFWFHFNLHNHTSKHQTYYLRTTEVSAHEIDFYILSKDQNQTIYKGMSRTNALGFVENKPPVIPITFKPFEEKKIYIKQNNLYPFFTSFHLLNKEEMIKSDLLHAKLIAYYLGAALVLILYNFFVFFFTRSKAHIFYVGYVTFFASWQAQTHGFFPFDFFTSSQTYYMSGSLIPTWIAFLVIFTLTLLDTSKLFPKIYIILRNTALVILLLGIYAWFDLQMAFMLLNIISIFLMPFLLYLGMKSYYAGKKVALIYIGAQIVFLSFSTIFSLMAEGFLPYNVLTRHGIIVGSFIEIFFFSLALGYKLKILEDEKYVLVHDANEVLEKTVQEKTQELQALNRKLAQLSITDKLTNITNRLGLDNSLAKMSYQFEKNKQPFGIILIDIDNFKVINDTYGHQCGDIILQNVATILSKNTRTSDTVGRWGGEEFLILCPTISLENLYKLAESLRHKVSISCMDNDKYITISLGIASFNENDTFDTVVSKADKALYQAKKQGKNTVCSES